MPEEFRQQLMRLAHTACDAFISNAYPYRQSVDKDSQAAVSALSALHAAKQNRAEYHIVAS
jgi:hypothetical protein